MASHTKVIVYWSLFSQLAFCTMTALIVDRPFVEKRSYQRLLSKSRIYCYLHLCFHIKVGLCIKHSHIDI